MPNIRRGRAPKGPEKLAPRLNETRGLGMKSNRRQQKRGIEKQSVRSFSRPFRDKPTGTNGGLKIVGRAKALLRGLGYLAGAL